MDMTPSSRSCLLSLAGTVPRKSKRWLITPSLSLKNLWTGHFLNISNQDFLFLLPWPAGIIELTRPLAWPLSDKRSNDASSMLKSGAKNLSFPASCSSAMQNDSRESVCDLPLAPRVVQTYQYCFAIGKDDKNRVLRRKNLWTILDWHRQLGLWVHLAVLTRVFRHMLTAIVLWYYATGHILLLWNHRDRDVKDKRSMVNCTFPPFCGP